MATNTAACGRWFKGGQELSWWAMAKNRLWLRAFMREDADILVLG